MDVQMPNMDGLEATSQIRAGKGLSSEKAIIIAMTANIMEGIQNRCLASGMNDYISKPLKMSSLRQVLIRYSNNQPLLFERNSSKHHA